MKISGASLYCVTAVTLAEGAIESLHNLTDYEDMAQTFKDLTQVTHKGDITHDRNQSA